MAHFTIQEVAEATGGTLYEIHGDLSFNSVSTDSRTIDKNALFVALKGPNFDGHTYVKEAFKKGATAVIVDHYLEGVGSQIVVSNTLAAYQQLGHFHRMRFSIPVVAVTGSSGKTTTKEMISTLLESKWHVLKTEKNFNNEIGLPKTLLELTKDHEVCVLEMGMRGLHQIEELCAIAKPTIGVVTNVGTSHIELLGSQEKIKEAKEELLRSLTEKDYAIINEDDPNVRTMKKHTKGKIMTYGIDETATVRGFSIQYKKDGLKFACNCYDEVFDVFLPMIGKYNVYNALAAITVGRILGLPSNKIAKSLGAITPMENRQEIIPCEDYTIFNDTYNANPSSMKEAIIACKQLESRRNIAILGSMLELGAYSEEAHRNMGALVVEEGYDALIVYGDDAYFIGDEAKHRGLEKVYYATSHDDIVNHYDTIKEKGDLILIKGSRGMFLEKVAKSLKNMLQ